MKYLWMAVVLVVLIVLVYSVSAGAEEFKVYFCFNTLDDTSAVEEEGDINVELWYLPTDMDKAKAVAAHVMKKVMEDSSEKGTKRLSYILDSVKQVGDSWYVVFKYNFRKDLIFGEKLDKVFRVKVDLKRKTVIHERSQDNQYTGPAPTYRPE